MDRAYKRPSGVRPRRRIKYGRFILPGIVFILVILALWLSLQWTLEALAWQFMAVHRANDGVLEDRLTLQVVIAREEQLIVAPVDGKLLPFVPEGERVPEGATIARLLPVAVEPYGLEAIDIKAPFSGQISYQTDGLEKALQPANLENINYQDLNKLASLAKPVRASGQVKSGTAIIRLVNNLEPLGIYTAVEELPPGWKQGKRLAFKIPEQDGELEVRITQTYDAGNQKVVIMEAPRWDIRWLQPRQMEIEAILNCYRGVIVPREALYMGPENEPGIYCIDTRTIRWQPVTILGQVGDQVAVEGLKTGVEVVVNPKLGRWLSNKA